MAPTIRFKDKAKLNRQASIFQSRCQREANSLRLNRVADPNRLSRLASSKSKTCMCRSRWNSVRTTPHSNRLKCRHSRQPQCQQEGSLWLNLALLSLQALRTSQAHSPNVRSHHPLDLAPANQQVENSLAKMQQQSLKQILARSHSNSSRT